MTFFKGPYSELPSQKEHGPWPFLDNLKMYKGRLVHKSIIEKIEDLKAKRRERVEGEEEDEDDQEIDVTPED